MKSMIKSNSNYIDSNIFFENNINILIKKKYNNQFSKNILIYKWRKSYKSILGKGEYN